MANSSLNLVNLDFDTLKASFVDYLKQQSQFQDYNFDSSAMNVLLDVLSYNTYKNAFYTNMIFAESFLDSALLKGSIFSHAKELNYLPRSARSSVANVTISFTASGENQPYLIRKGETFSSVIKQTSYTFSVAEDIILTSSDNFYTSTFDIYEGFYTKDSYIMDYTKTNQAFKITNDNVDTNSLVVLVYEDGEQVPKKFLRATTLLGLTEKSQVYFIQGTSDGKYEVLFGDSVLGRKPKNGSTVVLDYRVTQGGAANGARSFSINFDPTAENELTSAVTVGVNRYTPDTQGNYSVNGDSAETIESVKYYAPRHFQTQERAVTVNDYEIILKTQFPEIGAISVYGGEEVSPPRYGKVFIAVDVKNVEGLPDAKKIEYYNFIKSRSPLSIDPIFTEPSFTYVKVESNVKYNINLTTRTTQNIKADVVLTISNFADVNLNDFKASLRYSKLVRDIDDVDTSIVSNETELHVYKKIKPRLSVPQNIDLNFGLPIQQTDYVSSENAFFAGVRHEVRDTRAIHSTYFRYNGEKCIVEDDGAGKLRVVREEGNFHYVLREVGTVNYATGEIKLVNFIVDSFDGNFLKIYVSPKNKDIIGSRNEILSIEPDEILVTVEAIRE
jgi:hypothetical protein